MKKIILILIFAIVSNINLFSQIPSNIPTNGLIGYWPFNGNANDESGNNYHGTVTGADLVTDRFGNTNSAYFFDLFDEIKTSYIGVSGNGERTISLWSKNQYSNRTITPLKYGGGNTNYGDAFEIKLNRNYVHDQCSCWTQTYEGVGIDAGHMYLLYNTTIGDNQWHHYVIVVQENSTNFRDIKIYKDGQLISTSNNINFDYNNNSTQLNINTYTSNDNSLSFGRSEARVIDNDPGNMFTQLDAGPTEYLDDIAFWNRALTEQEISNIYNPLPSNIPTNGLIAYYPFNGNANDESGYGNHGVTLNGTQQTEDNDNNSNKAFLFDGEDDYIQTSLSHERLLGLTELTGSAWIKLGNNISEFGYTIFSTFYPSASQLNFLLGGSEDDNHQKLVLFINSLSGGSQVIISSNHIIPRNIWTQVSFTITNNLVKFYINGNEVHSEVILFDEISTEAPAPDFKIGQGNPTNGFRQDFNGKIDEVGLWDRVLTNQELLNLFASSPLSTEPTRQSKDIKVWKLTKNSIGIRWTKGNGENRVVVASENSLNSGNYVADGTSYNAGGFGVYQANTSDSYVVYKGNSNTCEITNLQNNKLYYFRVFEYYGNDNSTNYLTTSERSNPNNRMTLRKEDTDWEEPITGYSMNIYPNPAKDFINIEMNLPFESGEMIIADNEGREIYKTNDLSKLLNLDIRDFVNGTYHILISNGDEAIYNSFVIER